ncbi:hypothetical protein AOQ84DRAFT_361266 [Glonium stellatum]|uniref:NWD NACHT-NTPase N-terminal domain-containing protein n=1 Tax=Glonium stellatum TaxID=574774 RepID=A0A8E2JVZ7_9PEZI|nr:hypothetical protein AOQ84DRAFT_361266 [Glonium stellatum]
MSTAKEEAKSRRGRRFIEFLKHGSGKAAGDDGKSGDSTSTTPSSSVPKNSPGNPTSPALAADPSASNPDMTTIVTSRENDTTGVVSALSTQCVSSSFQLGNSDSDVSHLDEPSLAGARDAVWKRSYKKFRDDNPDLLTAYETLMIGSSKLKTDTLTPSDIKAVAETQRANMENKQWKFPWFGKSKSMRDMAESIVDITQQMSGLISAGMTMAPPYVSLPWSMIAILLPFSVSEIAATQNAIDGLKEVTSIMASYSLAEENLLGSKVTSQAFSGAVVDLYASIYAYQALSALYLAKSTLKRYGCSLKPKTPMKDALQKVKDEDEACQQKSQELGLKLTHHELKEGVHRMDQCLQQILAERMKRERILEWISPINEIQDHLEIRKQLGKSYIGSGRWLIDDQKVFRPWRSSKGVEQG